MARELSQHDPLTPLLRLRVVPNASRAEIVGWLEPGVLKLKVTAPPEGGRANKDVVALLAKTLGVSRRDIAVVLGAKSRQKTVALSGLTAAQLEERLPRP